MAHKLQRTSSARPKNACPTTAIDEEEGLGWEVRLTECRYGRRMSCCAAARGASPMARPRPFHPWIPASPLPTSFAGLPGQPRWSKPPAAPLRFFPAREYGAGGQGALPRLAALTALARMPEPPPVDLVAYTSAGRLAIVGPGLVALEWARHLQGKADGQIQVTVFAEDETPLPAASPRTLPVHRARRVSVVGWLC